ncbi:MAG: ArnT family glycosyltransferase [Ktedonobacteraceae bacterium]
MALVCLLLACVGVIWFAYQYFLVPQPKYFTPDWHGAQWVRASDGNATTAYFRYATDLQKIPDNAFVTIAASQVFRLYVNGTLIGSSSDDFGNYPRAYMYEITPSLVVGTNVIAIRVDNLDEKIPTLRATLTSIDSNTVSYYGTGVSWLATTQVSLVYPQDMAIVQALIAWSSQKFDATAWRSAQLAAQSPISPSLTVNALLYERYPGTQWITDGPGEDTYFVRQVSLPAGSSASWLRIASTGTTNIFINGNLVITWNYQPLRMEQTVINKATGKKSGSYVNELLLRVYDISPYLHSGTNTIAVHISLQSTTGVSDNSVPADTELALDMLTSDNQGHSSWLTSADGWRVSHQQLPGWTTNSNAVSSWTAPVDIAQPIDYRLVYLTENNLLSSEQQVPEIMPGALIGAVVVWSLVAVLASWLLMSLVVMKRYFRTRHAALEMMSLAYLPALALEGALMVLSGEPLIAKPFPYTGLWATVLLMVVGMSYFLLWLHARGGISGRVHAKKIVQHVQSSATVQRQVLAWLRMHWLLIPLVLVTTPMVYYNLGYEAYWQDELASYDVAQSIVHTGLPLLPSGFVYPKAELYSYLLALIMKLFGDQASTLRLISSVEYTLTVLLLYHVGCYFFDRRVALLASFMFAFSSHALIWARQVRMYQQAQLLTLLTVYLFFRAVQERRRVSLVYLAAGSLIITYLSHEETFIILPALLICILVASYVTKDAHHRLPSILYQKHWWYAAAIIVSVIVPQLIIVLMTHPPVLGTDVSMRPEIQFTTDNIQYYFNLLFLPTGKEPANNPLVANTPRTMLLNSLLCVLGCIWARKSRDLRVIYVALFLIISLLTLVFLFTMQADRYFYPLFTFYYLMAAFAFMKILRAIRAFAQTRSLRQRSTPAALPSSPGTSIRSHTLPMSVFVILASVCAFLSVVIMPVVPLSSYNLFISRALGLPYFHHFGDYTAIQKYLHQNLHKGDIVISIIPDSIVLYYAGQSDYFFSINHDLFLFEQDGHIVDTYTGKVAILNQTDFDTVLASHKRVWLISADNYYQRDVLSRFNIPLDFHIAYVGSNSIVYLRGG